MRVRTMLQRTLGGLCALALAGCAGGPDAKGPVTPTGTVSGALYTLDFAPISDATVTLEAPGVGDGGVITTQSDSSGVFSFTAIPALADVLVSAHKDGFSDAFLAVEPGASAGDYPIDNANTLVGPFTLARMTGTVKVVVFSASGRPAAGAKVQLVVMPAYGYASPALASAWPYGYPSGRLTYATTADSSGNAVFTGVPEPDDIRRIYNWFENYEVTVGGYDENGDGLVDSAGQTQFFTASSLVIDPSPRFIQLPEAISVGAFTVVKSNVQSLTPSSQSSLAPDQNLLRTGEKIYVALSHRLESVAVQLVDETGKTRIDSTTAIEGGTVLAVTPSTTLAAGHEYNLSVHAVSAETGAIYDGVGFFFVTDGAPAVTVSSIAFRDNGTVDGLMNPGEPLTVTFSAPVGFFGAMSGARIVYVNRDLDSSGTIGDSVGERGYAGPGLQLVPDEPVSETGTVFGLKASGYTTRWAVIYPTGANVPPGTSVDVDFTRLVDPTSGVQSFWGQALTTKLTSPLSVAP